jgi:hypothetical protein
MQNMQKSGLKKNTNKEANFLCVRKKQAKENEKNIFGRFLHQMYVTFLLAKFFVFFLVIMTQQFFHAHFFPIFMTIFDWSKVLGQFPN